MIVLANSSPPLCTRAGGLTSRRTSARVSATGRGFGSAGPKKTQSKRSEKGRGGKGPEIEDPHVARLLQRLDSEETRREVVATESVSELSDGGVRSQEAPPVPADRKNALGNKDGWVDFVKVESWEGFRSSGDGGPEADHLGELRVKSFVSGQAGASQIQGDLAAAKEASSSPRSNGSAAISSPPPLYERLVRHLALLESQGQLAVAQPRSKATAAAKPLPPFHQWKFTAAHFLQYLTDMQAVFAELDGVLEHVARGGGEGEREELRDMAQRLLLLSRTAELRRDVASLAASLLREKEGGGGYGVPKNGEEEGGGGTSAGGNVSVGTTLQPGTEAVAFAGVLRQLAEQVAGGAAEEDEGGIVPRGKKGHDGGESTRTVAILRSFAYAFSLYVTHVTTGMRVGARAVEVEPTVRASRAVSFCQDYSEQVSDPLAWLIESVNELGKHIDEAEIQEVMKELPKAMIRTSLTLKVLAV